MLRRPIQRKQCTGGLLTIVNYMAVSGTKRTTREKKRSTEEH